jgi:hypothetical protein
VTVANCPYPNSTNFSRKFKENPKPIFQKLKNIFPAASPSGTTMDDPANYIRQVFAPVFDADFFLENPSNE